MARSRSTSAAALAAALTLSACAAPQTQWPIKGPPVVADATPYSPALECLGREIAGQRLPRIAVGQITDYTGKFDADGGRRITQGASLMAVAALAKAGLPQVERLDMSVPLDELKFANNDLIGDGGAVRKIAPGSIEGSDLFLIGGITELNYNIGSVATSAAIGPADFGGQLYVMSVAIDLRLVDTASLRVVDVVSYRKQVVGREVSAGLFEFFGSSLFDLSVKEKALEPVQLAVRALIEKAAGEMVRRRFSVPPGACAPPPSELDYPAPPPERITT